MTTEHKQPTNEELRELLASCQGVAARVRLPGRRTAWNERVLALQEALDARRTWQDTEEDRELARHCRRYLRFAGVRV